MEVQNDRMYGPFGCRGSDECSYSRFQGSFSLSPFQLSGGSITRTKRLVTLLFCYVTSNYI